MKSIFRFLLPALFFIIASCTTTRNALTTQDDGKIEVVFVQVNDVYEIAPLSAGKEGGMARVATLKKKYLQKNRNTFLVMAGDFVSPSVYNSLQYEGKAIRGKQMIEAMNAAGMDFAVFGNHEFDIKENELQDRINESRFQWIASNAFHKKGENVAPFAKTNLNNALPIPKTYIKTVTDRDGTKAKIGFIGLTITSNKAEYVSYAEPLTTAKELYNSIKDSVDVVIAITHQVVQEDIRLARELPELAAILGGHEHDRRFEKVGNVYITKAHANARSAYIVQLNINKKRSTIKVDTDLELITEKIEPDSTTNAVVNKWADIAEKNYSTLGFDAKKVVLNSGAPLDGRESLIRKEPTNLSRLIVQAMEAAAPQADVAFFNAGSIRVDDILPMPLTQYDLIRAMPFGGGIREVDMKGSLLVKVLDQGKKNVGIGGFLQHSETLAYDHTISTWKLKGAPINPVKTYRVALTDFLITGKEANLDYLNEKSPDIVKVYEAQTAVAHPQSDIRLAVVKLLEKTK